ncbi:hypothetical protein FA13DRAFT_298875 [Coprinellus micaceus]|uniref:Uncharacterized protein n=1 Tax=Coprinellus micaceus TaxID=71717 RepID=A0A4Y7SDP5_COPMI|nr:hypothetical protein FA13DRAFT_298875 [Coprinellus micaceus]
MIRIQSATPELQTPSAYQHNVHIPHSIWERFNVMKGVRRKNRSRARLSPFHPPQISKFTSHTIYASEDPQDRLLHRRTRALVIPTGHRERFPRSLELDRWALRSPQSLKCQMGRRESSACCSTSSTVDSEGIALSRGKLGS